MEPIVSIVVCTRNRADYLRDCLQSIAAQDFAASFEVIVVDNASTDSTRDVIDDWCQKDSRVRGTYQGRVGLSAAKNAGVRLARGRYILFTDDDVIVQPSWIKTYDEFFSRHDGCSVVAGGQVVPVPSDIGPWPHWFDTRALVDVGLLDHQSERPLRDQEWLWGANMAVPAVLFTPFGLWNESLGRKGNERGTFEDVDFQERVRCGGGEVWFCPDAIVHHRVNSEEITPRRILTISFTRGLSRLRKDDTMRIPATEFILEPHKWFGCIMRLCCMVAAWTLLSVCFAATPSRRVFEKLRYAVWSSGRWLAALHAGNPDSRIVRLVQKLVFAVRRRLLRLTSDSRMERRPVKQAIARGGVTDR